MALIPCKRWRELGTEADGLELDLNLDGAAELARLAVLKKLRGRPDTVRVCNAVIRAMCQAKQYIDGISLFHYFFNEYKIVPNIVSFNLVMKAFSDMGRFDDALQLYRHAAKFGKRWRELGTEADGLELDLNLDGAAELARLAVLKKLRGRPDTVRVCNAVIRAMCQAKQYFDGNSLFHYFFNEYKIVPNIVSFNLVMKAFSDMGRFDDALQLYRHAAKFGADRQTYRLMAEALVKAYEPVDAYVEDVDDCFEEWRLEYKGKTCDRIATIFVDYSFKHGNEEKAMKCYSFIPQGKCLRATTGNTLLTILLSNGKKTEARELFNKMIKTNCFDSETVNVMVDECFKMGEFKEAMYVFNKSREGKRMAKCYSNTVARLCEHGMVSEAEGLFEEMSSYKDLSPDVPTFRSMINGYVRAGRVDDALKTSKTLALLNLRKVSINQD
ncbi:PREDICTED: pentatricopeptide repeat-containing protein At3g60960, mitochondrial-like [Camelina sativa]|uniref:Pentatricopeptide repeat-containing protein At3g60960, mitochondrial-like n=1 Tax=Camelina sativa TaxID=90675 RepID=A0ABM0YY40_CAMSA|nr:PREDICTED: pentatricopeptide repeat-containing protein At3g60960, mitochondrial-like [Camelina sativa]